METKISDLNLTDAELNFCMNVINRFGTGEHPVADTHTIDGFYLDYLLELFDEAELSDFLTEKGKDSLNAIRDKINEIQTAE